MINHILQLITEELNGFLGKKEPKYRDKNPAVLSDLVNQQGELIITISDKTPRDNIIITLINLERETCGMEQLPHIRRPDHSVDIANPEISLNLYVLFSAFSNMAAGERYGNCLALLTYVIRFFQYKNVFNHQNTLNLNSNIEKLLVEFISLNLEQQNHLWGALGTKYMPSVVYKVRMLSLRETDDAYPGSVIKIIDNEGKSKS